MNSKVQEMINLVREEMERMISRNPKQEKSMETDIQIVRELIPEAYVCLDNAVNVIWPAESMQEVENLLDDFAQMGILLKEYIENPKRPEWILSGKHAEIRLIPDMSIKNAIKPAKPCMHIVVGPDFPRPFAQGKEEEPR